MVSLFGIELGLVVRAHGPDGPRRRQRVDAALLGDHDERLAALVGAAVVVLDPVEDLGLIRALVHVVVVRVAVAVGVGAPVARGVGAGLALLLRAGVFLVGDAVAVVVRVGAAIEVLGTVLVLGLVGAAIGVVGDAVLVAVLGLGRAPVSLRVVAVDTLDRRASVDRIGHAVAVGVRRRASVLLRIVPPHAGHERAGVLRVEDAVAVGVVLGASVFVLDAVAVLGQIGALVAIVRYAVGVAIVRAGGPADRDDAAKRGDADGLVEPEVDAREHEGVVVVAELDAIVDGQHRRRQSRRAGPHEGRHRVRRQPSVQRDFPGLPVVAVERRHQGLGPERGAERPRNGVAEGEATGHAAHAGVPGLLRGAQCVAQAPRRAPTPRAYSPSSPSDTFVVPSP